nr:MAG TPA: hypothetical protein [Inoviridae sp.]
MLLKLNMKKSAVLIFLPILMIRELSGSADVVRVS